MAIRQLYTLSCEWNFSLSNGNCKKISFLFKCLCNEIKSMNILNLSVTFCLHCARVPAAWELIFNCYLSLTGCFVLYGSKHCHVIHAYEHTYVWGRLVALVQHTRNLDSRKPSLSTCDILTGHNCQMKLRYGLKRSWLECCDNSTLKTYLYWQSHTKKFKVMLLLSSRLWFCNLGEKYVQKLNETK